MLVPPRRSGPILASAILLALAFAGLYGHITRDVPSGWFRGRSGRPLFNADPARWVRYFAEGEGPFNRKRTRVHPLVVLGVNPWGSALRKWAFRGDAVAAARFLSCAFGGLAVGVSFWFFATVRESRLDGLLLACLLGSSHAMLTFGGMVESYALGLVTIIVPFCLLAGGWLPEMCRTRWLVAGVISISVTVTNLLQGLAAHGAAVQSARGLARLRSTARWLVLILLVAGILALIQKVAFPSTWLFFSPRTMAAELPEVSRSPLWGNPLGHLATVIRQFALFAVVGVPGRIAGEGVSLQASRISDLSNWGRLATACWVGLFAYACLRHVRVGLTRLSAGLIVGWMAFFLLHLVYGEETFLYSAHFVFHPIALVACAPCGRSAWPGRALLIATILLAAVNNVAVVRAHWAMAAT